jgi:organic radical activating enzyme
MRVKFPLNTTWIDYPDDCSEAVIIYIMGCEHKCKACQNPKFQNANYPLSQVINPYELSQEINSVCTKIHSTKAVISGGDSLSDSNLEETKELLVYLALYGIDVCLYTGYDIGRIIDEDVWFFEFVKVGKYLEQYKQQSEKMDEYIQFASRNQELYDSRCTLISNNGRYVFPKEN